MITNKVDDDLVKCQIYAKVSIHYTTTEIRLYDLYIYRNHGHYNILAHGNIESEKVYELRCMSETSIRTAIFANSVHRANDICKYNWLPYESYINLAQ